MIRIAFQPGVLVDLFWIGEYSKTDASRWEQHVSFARFVVLQGATPAGGNFRRRMVLYIEQCETRTSPNDAAAIRIAADRQTVRSQGAI